MAEQDIITTPQITPKTWRDKRADWITANILDAGLTIISEAKDKSSFVVSSIGEELTCGADNQWPIVNAFSINIQNTVSKVQLASRSYPTKQYTGGVTRTLTLNLIGPEGPTISKVNEVVNLFNKATHESSINKSYRKLGGVEIQNPIVQFFDMTTFVRASYTVNKSDVSTTSCTLNFYPVKHSLPRPKLVKSTNSLRSMQEKLLREIVKYFPDEFSYRLKQSLKTGVKRSKADWKDQTKLETDLNYIEGLPVIITQQAQYDEYISPIAINLGNEILNVVANYRLNPAGTSTLVDIFYEVAPKLKDYANPNLYLAGSQSDEAAKVQEYLKTLSRKRDFYANAIHQYEQSGNLDTAQKQYLEDQLESVKNDLIKLQGQGSSLSQRTNATIDEALTSMTRDVKNTFNSMSMFEGPNLHGILVGFLSSNRVLAELNNSPICAPIIQEYSSLQITDSSPVYNWLNLPTEDFGIQGIQSNAFNPDFFMYSDSETKGTLLKIDLDPSITAAIEKESELINEYIIDGSTVPGLNMSKDIDSLLKTLSSMLTTDDPDNDPENDPRNNG